VVARSDDDDIAWQLVQLHKQERNDSLDLPRFMSVAPLLADGVELIEEQDAGLRSNVIEQLAQSGIGFAQVTADQRIVSDYEEWIGEGLGDPLGIGGLPVPGRPGQ